MEQRKRTHIKSNPIITLKKEAFTGFFREIARRAKAIATVLFLGINLDKTVIVNDNR